MEVIINEIKKFKKDLNSFSPIDQARVRKKINELVSMYLENPENLFRHMHKLPFRVSLQDGYNPSVMVLRISHDIRVIVSFEMDPIFDQLIIYLFRCIRHEDLDKAYRGLAESLYQRNLIIKEGE